MAEQADLDERLAGQVGVEALCPLDRGQRAQRLVEHPPELGERPAELGERVGQRELDVVGGCLQRHLGSLHGLQQRRGVGAQPGRPLVMLLQAGQQRPLQLLPHLGWRPRVAAVLASQPVDHAFEELADVPAAGRPQQDYERLHWLWPCRDRGKRGGDQGRDHAVPGQILEPRSTTAHRRADRLARFIPLDRHLI